MFAELRHAILFERAPYHVSLIAVPERSAAAHEPPAADDHAGVLELVFCLKPERAKHFATKEAALPAANDDTILSRRGGP